MSEETPPSAVTLSAPDLEAVKARFAGRYAEVQRIARYQHRGLRGDLRDEAVTDTIGLAWRSYLRMALEGGDADGLLKSIVRFSARHVRAGKGLAGHAGVSDIMSRRARGGHVEPLPRGGVAGTAPDPAEEACCRADYAEWLDTLSDKQRALAKDLEAGLNLTEIAGLRGVSKSAVQDMRAALARNWDRRFGGR